MSIERTRDITTNNVLGPKEVGPIIAHCPDLRQTRQAMPNANPPCRGRGLARTCCRGMRRASQSSPHFQSPGACSSAGQAGLAPEILTLVDPCSGSSSEFYRRYASFIGDVQPTNNWRFIVMGYQGGCRMPRRTQTESSCTAIPRPSAPEIPVFTDEILRPSIYPTGDRSLWGKFTARSSSNPDHRW